MSVERLVQMRVSAKLPWAKEPHQREEPAAAGRYGAALAAQRFQPRYGTRFSSYAILWIDGEITRWIEGEVAQSELKRHAAAVACEYLAEEPDTFEVACDEPPVTRAGVHGLARRFLGCLFAGVAMGPPDPEQAAISAERRAKVREALERLDEGKRVVFEMKCVQGLKLGEIMDALDISDRTARRWFEEAMEAIFEAVRPLDEEP